MTTVKETTEREDSKDYEIIIIECCENCETHQNQAKHSEWKYFEQFNQLKRKVEKFIPNTIVIKNPVPDQLIKTNQLSSQKNIFLNKTTNQNIVFPRIGAFEIYIYNILISSKLMTTQWPNHYKIIQVIAKIIEDKKSNNALDQYSVYFQDIDSAAPQQPEEDEKEKEKSNEKKGHRIVSKKKKAVNTLTSKAYKSIERSNYEQQKSILDPIATKLLDFDEEISPKKKNPNRYLEVQKKGKDSKLEARDLQSKADNRIKLPALNNSKAFEEKKPFLTIEKKEQLEKNKKTDTYEQLNSLQFRQQQSNDNFSFTTDHQEDFKMMENKSVQYTDHNDKEFMNRAIQYEEIQGFYCDFALQVENQIIPKELSIQFVQTDKIEVLNQPKPYLLDEIVQANIEIQKEEADQEMQTPIQLFMDHNSGTQIIATVNRGYQFPQQLLKSINQNEVVDPNFVHLYEKRRNIVDNEHYSIDKFEERSTKYKWIGRAGLIENLQEMKQKIFLQSMVFSVYNFYGIKSPERRLSYQLCANVAGDKMKDGAIHIMTSQNPELQYLFQFEEYNYEEEKYPLSELITFRSSKQSVKFNNYGGLLALAYFLNDTEIFNKNNNQIGLVVVNEAIKQIHKMSCMNYQIHGQTKNSENEVVVSLFNNSIKLDRLSQTIELEFFAMLARLSNQNSYEELTHYVRDIFIRNSNTYQHYRNTLASLKLQKSQDQVVEDFLQMLNNRLLKIRQTFQGKLYTFQRYRTLNPTINFALPLEGKVARKLLYKDKMVTSQEVIKHLRNKDNIVMIEGEDGLGKSTLLGQMSKELKEMQKLNVIEYLGMKKEQFKIKEELFQLSKNIVLIDNAELFESDIFTLIQRLRNYNFEISYCIATSKNKHSNIFKNRFANLSVIETNLLSLDAQQIRVFLMKSVRHSSFTTKKELVDKLLLNGKFIKILQNPFYLNLFSHYLSRSNLEQYQPVDRHITKYMILKEHISHCNFNHCQEMKQMGLDIKEAFPTIRRIAFEYFHHHLEVTETIRDIIAPFEENQLIRSQLAYYPLNLDSTITTNYEALFVHPIFFKFYLNESYSYFVEKGFRSLQMERLYENKELMEMMRQRYEIEESHSKLIQTVMESKRFSNTAEASSNAITLLAKIGFIFSNINFDDCIIPDADLSTASFYQCSFRSADLERTVLYKSQMINCILDNAQMARINLYSKKYEIQFAAMTASLSTDARRIAFGCGNYLIILNAETGAEYKRIEAHLDIIRLVRYTRDGNSLITVADDKTLRIWDIYTYKSVVFKLPQKGSISYSNQTQTIASVNKNTLHVWNLKSMANQAELEGHTDLITTVEFSFDGSQILTGSKDSTLRLWSLKGKQKSIYKGHDGDIIVGKMSPNRRTIVSTGKDKSIIMWQTQTANKLNEKKFKNEIPEVCLDDKEQFIIITYNNDNHIVILDFITFHILHTLPGHQAKIVTISFDHHFETLLSLGKDRTARLWQLNKIMQNQLRTNKISRQIHDGPVVSLAYQKIKRRYATSHPNGEINIWDGQRDDLLEQFVIPSGFVKCLSFDKLGRLYGGTSMGTLIIWDLQNKRDPKTIELHSSQIISMRLSQKSRLVATSSIANELVMYDYTGFSVVMSTREQGRLNAIEFNQEQKVVAVGGVERYVVLFSVSSSNTIVRSEELGVHSDCINALCFFGDNLLVVAMKNGEVAIWNYLKASLMKKIENVSSITNIIPFQKKYICFTSEDGKTRVIDMDQGKEIKTYRYSEFPAALSLNHDETLLYSATNQGNILKWNLNFVRPKSKKIEFNRKAIDSDCSKMAIVESSRLLNIRDLIYHGEQLVEVKVDSDIEGVTFDDQNRIVVLLKNGKYWEVNGHQYRFNSSKEYEGDLFYIRDRNYTNFFKSGIKKIKGMNKPAMAIIEEINQ